MKCYEQYKHFTSKHTFSVKERIVLAMMKLKHNTTTSFLSSLFNCFLSRCVNIISETIGILAIILSSTVISQVKRRSCKTCHNTLQSIKVSDLSWIVLKYQLLNQTI